MSPRAHAADHVFPSPIPDVGEQAWLCCVVMASLFDLRNALAATLVGLMSIALVACSRPSAEPQSTGPTTPPSAADALPTLRDVDWSSIRVPDICGPSRSRLVRLSNFRARSHDLVANVVMDRDSLTFGPDPIDPRHSEVVAVTLYCELGTSSPETVVFFAPGEEEPIAIGTALDGTPAYVQRMNWTSPGRLELVAKGISPDAPSCCPDLLINQVWTYAGGHILLNRTNVSPLPGHRSKSVPSDDPSSLEQENCHDLRMANAEEVAGTGFPGHSLRLKSNPVYDSNVEWIQDFLNVSLADCVPEDGFFGPKTRAGVVRFQESYGLPATGVVDRATFEQLRAGAVLYFE
jgi:hypothetical protein